ncbi:ABC transporter ATP-binding protein [Aciduricibacillus chroicocephali]|uniref:Putative hemin import ATP-binding protein HrtA n=1 Tax=Aciduricibacillus chroicocephali TaxID=3054939 RepID=A0ABY9KUM4_9BACI|nr:ABC transporter ATP-binding protein [Bacillaceae bacterium 44XB]
MAVLEMHEANKVFGTGNTKVEALKKTDFQAEAGDLIAVIGPSGSGKSTFLTVAGGLQEPTSGEVLINGTKIRQLGEKKLSKIRLQEIGFVLQASNLVPFLTVKQQMQLLDKVKKDNLQGEELERLYEALGINDFLHKLPGDLSGGQRQRVAIAKAFYANPSILLADEPTASLDSDRAFEVMDLFKRVTKENNKTTIVVTHDTRLIGYCDKVYNITDGVLKEVDKESIRGEG